MLQRSDHNLLLWSQKLNLPRTQPNNQGKDLPSLHKQPSQPSETKLPTKTDTAPKRADTAPKSADTTPKNGCTTPENAKTALKSAGTELKSDDNPSKPEAAGPQTKDGKRQSNTPPKNNENKENKDCNTKKNSKKKNKRKLNKSQNDSNRFVIPEVNTANDDQPNCKASPEAQDTFPLPEVFQTVTDEDACGETTENSQQFMHLRLEDLPQGWSNTNVMDHFREIPHFRVSSRIGNDKWTVEVPEEHVGQLLDLAMEPIACKTITVDIEDN